MKQKLYRSRDDVLVAGVLSGLAEYFGHDATWWRLAFAVALVATAIMPGVLLYILAWIIIPKKPAIEYYEV